MKELCLNGDDAWRTMSERGSPQASRNFYCDVILSKSVYIYVS